jgi:hypothetical protein
MGKEKYLIKKPWFGAGREKLSRLRLRVKIRVTPRLPLKKPSGAIAVQGEENNWTRKIGS